VPNLKKNCGTDVQNIDKNVGEFFKFQIWTWSLQQQQWSNASL